MKSVLPKNLNIQAWSKDLPIGGRVVTVAMPPNNDKQNDAITKALTQTFTVIQRPPGILLVLFGCFACTLATVVLYIRLFDVSGISRNLSSIPCSLKVSNLNP